MNVGWLIDGDMFPHYRDDLVAAVKSHGHVAKLVHAPSPPFRWDDAGCSYRETFPAEHCVVSHGDIELILKIHAENRWNPGAFATVENYLCSNYANYLGEFWLNRDYVMLPFGELRRRSDFLFEHLGVDGRIFVRPDSPLKLFTGQTAGVDSFDADLEYMAFYDFPIESLAVVSSPKNVLREWRFVAANNQIIAGCLYCENGVFESLAEIDSDAESLASQIAAHPFSPDPVYIIDICETDDGCFHLLEIGGFSFADLYACNKSDIVNAVSNVALAQWQTNDA